MRQSNKSVSVRNDEIFNLYLGSRADPWVSFPSLLQNTGHIYWFHVPKQISRENKRKQKWDQTPIKLYRTVLVNIHRTQSWEIELEHNLKRGSGKINMLKQRKRSKQQINFMKQPRLALILKKMKFLKFYTFNPHIRCSYWFYSSPSPVLLYKISFL